MTLVEFLQERITEDESIGIDYRRDCDAKWAIIDEHQDAGDSNGWRDAERQADYGQFDHVCSSCGYPAEFGVAWPCRTLRILAAVYSSHPGYQPEWAL